MSNYIDPRTVEVTQRGDSDKGRWCEQRSEHEWEKMEDKHVEYWCSTCCAEGQLVRPLGAKR